MHSVSSDEQLQPPNTLSPYPTQTLLHSSSHFGLKSTNVFLHDYFEPTEAIILIEHGKIHDIIIPKDTKPEVLAEIYSQWSIKDHGNLHIFPGLVDCNVHLHADFNSEWDNIVYCTEAAAAGGVTTIVDNPIMTKPFEFGSEYVAGLQQKITVLKENCKVDFGVFALLEPKTLGYINQLLQLGVMGLKCFLLSCMQDTIGHFQSEAFPELMEILEKFKDLLIMVHPETATERDLYLTSPCRNVPLTKRLDKKHVIKSIELGGAANKGSYLDELCKKSTNKEDDDDDDDDCPTATLDTPSKLKGKVKKTKEKNEIDDLVHFELLSYGYNSQKDDKNEGSSSDSDNEVSAKKKIKRNSLPTCAEVAETSSDNPEEDGQENQSYLSNIPLKKSTFSRSSTTTREIKTIKPIKPIKLGKNTKPQEEEKDEKKEREDYLVLRDEPSPLTKTATIKEENVEVHSAGRIKSVEAESIKPLQITKAKSVVEPGHGLRLGQSKTNQSEANTKKTLNQTRKLLTFLTVCDAQDSYGTSEKSHSSNSQSPQPIIDIGNKQEPKEEHKEIKSAPTVIIDRRPKLDTLNTDNHHIKSQSQIASPASSRPVTPASSSLLQRRMSRKSSNGIAISATSTLSSPSSDFTKINSLDVIKSPRSIARKEAKYNRSYRIFLANRPQNWEENAVTLILSSIKHDTNLRILLPNLSLASSFLKVRQKKKSHETLVNKIFSDASPAHLFFNEKMVKKGDTKYKVSPPFRNKENRRLLVENFRLGGIDLISSYHFYVPPRFKHVDEGNFRRAFGGLDSMGCSLQAVWTAAHSYQQKTNKRFSDDIMYQKKIVNRILWQICRSMCYNPAQMLKIDHKKGMIAKGRDADLVLWDPYKIVNHNDLAPNHAFSGRSLLGEINRTYLRGEVIFDAADQDQVSKDYRPEFIRPAE